jgi:hypothetical protein
VHCRRQRCGQRSTQQHAAPEWRRWGSGRDPGVSVRGASWVHCVGSAGMQAQQKGRQSGLWTLALPATMGLSCLVACRLSLVHCYHGYHRHCHHHNHHNNHDNTTTLAHSFIPPPISPPRPIQSPCTHLPTATATARMHAAPASPAHPSRDNTALSWPRAGPPCK